MNWDKLRKEFFEQCTDDHNGLRKVNLSPHNLFNWFKDKIQVVKRTNAQNRALHLYFKQLADQLNNAGYTDDEVIAGELVSLKYTDKSLKEFWRKCQIHMFNFESTTQLNTEQINDLIDVFSLHFGQKGIYVEFPNWQSFLNKLDAKNY